MVQVNETMVKKIADLARLELTEAEVHKYTTQMQDTLAYVDLLNEVDVTGVLPMTHPHQERHLREDEAKSFGVTAEGHPKVMEHAPEVLFDGYKVPPIL
jgi:aspartyl-tRNA(Asn)/glutamyl-tRNA(Gln) amidotransferase subunit C